MHLLYNYLCIAMLELIKKLETSLLTGIQQTKSHKSLKMSIFESKSEITRRESHYLSNISLLNTYISRDLELSNMCQS